MPKQPIQTRERFRIHCEADLAQLGPIIAALSRLGIEEIGHELITDVRTFNKNNRIQHETSSADVVLEYVKEHPTFKIKELVDLFRSQGRTNMAAYAAVKTLCEKNVLTKLGGGNYSERDVRQIAAPQSKKQQDTITNKELILDYIKSRKQFTTRDLAELFKSKGRKPNSISPVLVRFNNEKLIKGHGNGMYDVLKTKTKLNGKMESVHG